MNLFYKVLGFALLATASSQDAARSRSNNDQVKASTEKAEFWSRYLDTVDSMSMAKPTSNPTPAPTENPSPMPSNAPTNVPSQSPTLRPTTQPTPFPTELPSISPSDAPSTNPTVSGCSVDVSISCFAAGGIPCDLLAPPVECEATNEVLVPLVYSYTIENTGVIETDIVSVQRTRNGESVDLSGIFSVANPLFPLDTFATSETEIINVCSDNTYETSIFVEADPPEGFNCQATDDFVFETLNRCRVDLQVGCVTDVSGMECTDFSQPTTQCVGPLSLLTLRYVDSSCDDGSDEQGDASTCTEFNGGLSGGLVNIACVDPTGEIFGQADLIRPDESFTVQSDEQLPTTLICTFSALIGTILQQVSFDASGVTDLALKDRFGGLSVEGCTDITGMEQKCLVDVTWAVEASNTGENDLTLSLLEYFGEDFEKEVQIDAEVLMPGDVTQFSVFESFDACAGGNFTTTFRTEANSEGGSCEAETTYNFFVNVPTEAPTQSPTGSPSLLPSSSPSASPSLSPSATPSISPSSSSAPSHSPSTTPTLDPLTAACEISADIECTVANEGGSCDDLRAPSAVTCLGSNANFIQFTFAPESSCDLSDNNSTNFQCQDLNLDIPRPRSAFIRVFEGDITWFAGSRSAGQIFDIPVSGDTISIEVYTAPDGILLQQSTMSIQCNPEDGMTLSTTFGHLELVGFRNDELGLQQVFASLEIVYRASNIGSADLDLFGAFGSSPFSGFQDFLAGAVQTLAPDESDSFVERLTLNLAANVAFPFQFTFLVQGNGSLSQVFCESTDILEIAVS